MIHSFHGTYVVLALGFISWTEFLDSVAGPIKAVCFRPEPLVLNDLGYGGISLI
jgi:hypothetical protein